MDLSYVSLWRQEGHEVTWRHFAAARSDCEHKIDQSNEDNEPDYGKKSHGCCVLMTD